MAFKKPHEVFFRKGILKNFAKNYKKTPAPVFFKKLQAWDAGAFQWILENFPEHLFYRIPPGDRLCSSTITMKKHSISVFSLPLFLFEYPLMSVNNYL